MRPPVNVICCGNPDCPMYEQPLRAEKSLIRSGDKVFRRRVCPSCGYDVSEEWTYKVHVSTAQHQIRL